MLFQLNDVVGVSPRCGVLENVVLFVHVGVWLQLTFVVCVAACVVQYRSDRDQACTYWGFGVGENKPTHSSRRSARTAPLHVCDQS